MVGMLGFICWMAAAAVVMTGNSAIHEILGAIIALNGTVLVAAQHVTHYVCEMNENTKSLNTIKADVERIRVRLDNTPDKS